MPEPTVAELLRLDDLLEKADEMSEIRWKRLWAAHAVKFEWPFSTGDDWLFGEEAVLAWRRWGGLEEYSL